MFFQRNTLPIALILAATQVNAFFRINCGIIQTGRVDPIVNPGAVSAHAHTIVGGSNIGVNSTYASLFNSECTSCEVGKDKSAYWTPNLYYQHPNGSFEEVPHSGSVVYYITRGPNENNLTPFPKGFQMLSGNKALRAYNQSGMTWGNATYPNRPIAEAVSFACLSVNIGPDTYNMVNVTTCINGLRAQLHFQTCWNGKDLYKADNSHVAHLSQIDDGICPPNYPYQLPHIFIETNYAVDQVSNITDGGQYVFSQGDPTGYGFHGDFINGWDSDVLLEAINTCMINGGGRFGTIDECPILIESDSTQAPSNCPERPPQIDEPVHGMLARLPGCVRVTYGPGAATAADMECGAGVKQPSISTTIDGTPLATYTPAIGQPFGNKNNVFVGCGNDTYGSALRTVNAIYNEDPGMTVENCQSYCTSKGYRISGVEYGYQCWCDLDVNPTTVFTANYTTRYGCMMSCPGNRSEVCGGPDYINVYNNTDPSFNVTTDQTNSVIQLKTPLAPYASSYLGCASEGTTGRALNGFLYTADNMTLDYCRTHCQIDNWALYGTEFSTQCWCGNSLESDSKIVDTITTTGLVPTLSACNQRCAGNFSQICGQQTFLSVYNNTLYKPVVMTKNVGKYFAKGCLTEPTTPGIRALAGSATTADNMTPQMCVKFCLGGGYHYVGVEYGTQCFCANSITAGANALTCDVASLMPCPGNKYTYCGAGNLLNLYYSATL